MAEVDLEMGEELRKVVEGMVNKFGRIVALIVRV